MKASTMQYQYHRPGRQRPIFPHATAANICYFVDLPPGSAATVEVSYDPPTCRSRTWEPAEPGLAGILYGVPTALRLHVLQHNAGQPITFWVQENGRSNNPSNESIPA